MLRELVFARDGTLLETVGEPWRTVPAPDGRPIRPMAADPSVPGRLWCRNTVIAVLGYTDDDGGTFVGKTNLPGYGQTPAHSPTQLLFAGSYAWAVMTPTSGNGGQVWRSPLPDASGNGLSWSKVWDANGQVNGPGGAAGDAGDLVSMRNSVLAVHPSGAAYLGEYSSGDITGGPSLYYSANASTATPGDVTWSKVKQWPSCKHIHAVKVINDRLWVSTGDFGSTNGEDDVGLWVTDDLPDPTAATWVMRSLATPATGDPLQIINFQTVTIDGQQMIVGESDQRFGHGPIVFPDATGDRSMVTLPLCHLPPPYIGTMRQLTLDPDTGILYWCTTGEGGRIGPRESLWMAAPPYDDPVLLESLPLGTFAVMGDPVVSGGFFWIDTSRCRIPVT